MRSQLLFIVVILVTGCSRQEPFTIPVRDKLSSKALPEDGLEVGQFQSSLKELVEIDKARLLKTVNSRTPCMESVRVPMDFPTIQDALDHVCPGGDIIVSAGEYFEDVIALTPGVHIKGRGNVYLNGGFVVYADDIMIQNFTIDAGLHSAPYVIGIGIGPVTGGLITHNTVLYSGDETVGIGIVLSQSTGQIIQGNNISGTASWGMAVNLCNDIMIKNNDIAVTGSPHPPENEAVTQVQGMRLFSCSNVVIRNNEITGGQWGIYFFSIPVTPPCNHNTISNNRITGISYASVIGLQGDCDYNVINGNDLTDNPGIFNAGIMLYSRPVSYPTGFCDNNIVKNNVSSRNYAGVWINRGGTNNTVGPNNTLDDNQEYGFYISGSATGNTIFNNHMVNNTTCDIGNYADDPSANTLSHNTYDCCENCQ